MERLTCFVWIAVHVYKYQNTVQHRTINSIRCLFSIYLYAYKAYRHVTRSSSFVITRKTKILKTWDLNFQNIYLLRVQTLWILNTFRAIHMKLVIKMFILFLQFQIWRFNVSKRYHQKRSKFEGVLSFKAKNKSADHRSHFFMLSFPPPTSN